MSADKPIPKALTIAGSDPSGGAGIQADLKTFSRLRVYGMAVIAAMTAQNTLGVLDVREVEPDFVAEQLDAVLSDIPPDATKTGMLLTAGVIEVVAQKIRQFNVPNLVVDPVLMSTSGAALMDPDALTTFRRSLLPVAFLVTPNMEEAGALAMRPVRTIEDMQLAARQIHDMGPRYVLIKGGHLGGNEATDVLFDGKEYSQFRSLRLSVPHTHGTGCVLAAAISGYLALGKRIEEAVASGKEFVTRAIENGLPIGKGIGPCDPLGLL